ncbi:hypothetical protein [Aureimonas altamirensis]|nr:hypothetical protein [Aureimonas altamirensis]
MMDRRQLLIDLDRRFEAMQQKIAAMAEIEASRVARVEKILAVV